MKAIILAAGFGTRLLPYTNLIPKPLFPIAGRPILDILIRKLIIAGCDGIGINTHHLPHAIENFILSQHYAVQIEIRYEPVILGTGGAIKNFSDFLNYRPFMVINGDIVFDFDLKQVYDFHLNHNCPATLVLTDDPDHNSVSLSDDGFVSGFKKDASSRCLTFTGIQVLDPIVLKYIPENTVFSSIDAFQSMIRDGKKIKAYLSAGSHWTDIGKPETYRKIAADIAGMKVFYQIFPDYQGDPIQKVRLTGDGSDRQWFRLSSGTRSVILADHGIRKDYATSECEAFVHIGSYLNDIGIPTPQIYFSDVFSGLVFVEDLGDVNLQAVVKNSPDDLSVIRMYQQILDCLFQMSQTGIICFDPSWTYQTPAYDRNLILERECRYFIDAFLKGYAGMDVSYEEVEEEVKELADKTLTYAVTGLMHRDCQSRNIMIKDGQFYFIDIQGARIGPLQYDAASLLIDPYVNLSMDCQSILLKFCVETLCHRYQIHPEKFIKGYRCCRLTRSLQLLGAFGFLSRAKHKTWFETYIPTAVRQLKTFLSEWQDCDLSKLTGFINRV